MAVPHRDGYYLSMFGSSLKSAKSGLTRFKREAMKEFSLLAILRQFGIQATIPTAIILGGHWFRYGALDLQNFLTAAVPFVGYLLLASWLEWRRNPKI